VYVDKGRENGQEGWGGGCPRGAIRKNNHDTVAHGGRGKRPILGLHSTVVRSGEDVSWPHPIDVMGGELCGGFAPKKKKTHLEKYEGKTGGLCG